MASDAQMQRLDGALDRIEATILPSLALMLETLLEAAEDGAAVAMPEDYPAELQAFAAHLRKLTREIEGMAPAAAADARAEAA